MKITALSQLNTPIPISLPARTQNPERRTLPAVNMQWWFNVTLPNSYDVGGSKIPPVNTAWTNYLAYATEELASMPPLPNPDVLSNNSPLPVCYGFVINGEYGQADGISMQYGLSFISATCYFEAWWDEVTVVYDENVSGSPNLSLTPLNVVSRHVLWTPPENGGYCLPTGWKPDDIRTYPGSDIFTLDQSTVPAPWSDPVNFIPVGLAYGVTNFRYSQIAGYTPPNDGSANGFPVS